MNQVNHSSEKIALWRHQAEEARDTARKSTNFLTRNQFLDLARHYEMLADNYEWAHFHRPGVA